MYSFEAFQSVFINQRSLYDDIRQPDEINNCHNSSYIPTRNTSPTALLWGERGKMSPKAYAIDARTSQWSHTKIFRHNTQLSYAGHYAYIGNPPVRCSITKRLATRLECDFIPFEICTFIISNRLPSTGKLTEMGYKWLYRSMKQQVRHQRQASKFCLIIRITKLKMTYHMIY